MKERICTLVWGTAWGHYGENFANTFEEFWPSDVELSIVTDAPLPTERAAQVPLETVQGYSDFMAKYGSDRKANGYDRGNKKTIVRYDESDEAREWRFDAVLWMPQILSPRACIEGLNDGDILAWFDADTETIAKVPQGWLSSIVGSNDIAIIQRPKKFSELGFWAVRISAKTRKFLNDIADIYESGAVFELEQWHSGFVFDYVVASSKMKVKNLTPPRSRQITGGSIWWKTVVGQYTNHLKGKLKFMSKPRRERMINKKRLNASLRQAGHIYLKRRKK